MAISSALGSSALLPAGLGFRNAIINGDFRINQRGFTSTTTSDTYGQDRWRLVSSGGCTYSAESFTIGNAISNYEPEKYGRLVTTGQSGTGVYSILAQRIEGVRTFAGQTVTVSFYAKANSGTPSVFVELEQQFGTGGSPSGAIQKSVGNVTLSTSWNRYVVTAVVPSISGKTIGSNNNDFISLNLWVSAGTDFNTRTNTLGIQSNTFDFWGVQLEQNYQPTPFEQRPIGVELALCERYYYRAVGGANYTGFCMGIVATTTAIDATFPHKTMRAKPTAVYYSNLGASDAVATTFSVTSVTIAHAGVSSSLLTVGCSGGGMTTYRPMTILANNSTSAYIAVEAEL